MTSPPPSGILGTAARDPNRGRRAGEIADLARRTLGLTDDTAVTVSQLACREPGCPPVETVIAVLGPAGRRWTIHRPLADVDDLYALTTPGSVRYALDDPGWYALYPTVLASGRHGRGGRR